MANIVITGAAGGFGFLTVKRLLADGHKVVGSARDISGRNKAKAAELEKLDAKVVEMDVASDSSVAGGIEEARTAFGGIDVLINNAGVGAWGPVESFTSDDMKRIFEVNLFGVQRLNRAVLPMMREEAEGLIVIISSTLGRVTTPFYGPYNASKWALEALTENYRTELSQFGIEFCLVEPGGYLTTFIDNVVRPTDTDQARAKAYGPMKEMAEGFRQNFQKAMATNTSQDPQNVAAAIGKLIATPYGTRPFRTIVDNMGMAGPIGEYNNALGNLTEALYGKFGIAHLLRVKVD
jgi:NAD(P)-dependent dehydrogenase (short-subunit alcohol dehydrogenase family)